MRKTVIFDNPRLNPNFAVNFNPLTCLKTCVKNSLFEHFEIPTAAGVTRRDALQNIPNIYSDSII